MTQSLLIIVSGPSCSGKTTLAQKISAKFNLPLVTKDSLKELIFDHLGWSDREWSKKVGAASYHLLHYFMETQLAVGNSLMIESNFKAEFETPIIKDLVTKYNYFPIQVMCQCDGQILFDRFKQRSESGDRHPGHNDQTNYDEFKDMLLQGKLEPLDIGGEIITFDTTDFNKLDYASVFTKIQQFL
jgi:hypothetical protein